MKTTAEPVVKPARAYEPPTGDEPLDDIEQALVRALLPILVDKILGDASIREERVHRSEQSMLTERQARGDVQARTGPPSRRRTP